MFAGASWLRVNQIAFHLLRPLERFASRSGASIPYAWFWDGV